MPLLEPFSMANGLLTQTMKVRKNVAMDEYNADIKKMYAET